MQNCRVPWFLGTTLAKSVIQLWNHPPCKAWIILIVHPLIHPVTEKGIFNLHIQTPNIRANRCLIITNAATSWDNNLQVKAYKGNIPPSLPIPTKHEIQSFCIFSKWEKCPASHSHSSQMAWWSRDQSTSGDPRKRQAIITCKGRHWMTPVRLSRSTLETATGVMALGSMLGREVVRHCTLWKLTTWNMLL